MSGWTYPGSGAVGAGALELGSTVGATNDGAGVGSNSVVHANAGCVEFKKASTTTIANTIAAPMTRSRFR
jgi:hypothetical protein